MHFNMVVLTHPYNGSVALSIHELQSLQKTANRYDRSYPKEKAYQDDLREGEYVEFKDARRMAAALHRAFQAKVRGLLFDDNDHCDPFDYHSPEELRKAYRRIKDLPAEAAILALRTMGNCERDMKEALLLYKIAQFCANGNVFISGSALFS